MMYRVYITEHVLDLLAESSGSIESKALKAASLIASNPEIGREYQAENGDDEPPAPCRCYPLPGTTKTLCYCVSHSEKRATVFALIDQRKNPAYRFRETRQSNID